MEATLRLSKPLFISHAHKPTITNLHHKAASFHPPSSLPGSNFRTRPHQLFHHQTMRVDVGDLSTPAGPMCLSGAVRTCPEIVGMDPMFGRNKMLMERTRRVPSQRSLTLEGLRRGSLSLKVLLEEKQARLNPQLLDNALCELEGLLSQLKQPQHRVAFYKLEEVAIRLEMSRKEDLAVEMLKRFLSSSVTDQSIGSHERYEVNLLLVEMLIYKGEYEEARDICTKLEQEHITAKIYWSSPQPYPPSINVPVERIGPTNYKLKLYQAVTNAMLDEMSAASGHWDEFASMTSSGLGVGGPPKVDEDHSGPPEMATEDDEEEEHRHLPAFLQFLDYMCVLKQEIREARK